MSKPNILITGDFELPQFVDNKNIIHLKNIESPEIIIQNLNGIEYYIIGGPEYVDDNILSYASSLKKIIVMGTGISSFVDIKSAKDRNIFIENTPGINSDAVAEFALGSIIINIANSFYSRDSLLKGYWYQKNHKTLSTLKIGILGMGNISTSFIKKIRALQINSLIYYHSKTRKEDLEQNLNIEYKSLCEIGRNIDTLILFITYNEDTHHLIDNDFIDSLQTGVNIFNFSNPRIIDSSALKKNLLSKKIAFAFFDGYYDEWINNKGLADDKNGLLGLGSDKFIATSHIAAQADNVILKIIEEALKKTEN